MTEGITVLNVPLSHSVTQQKAVRENGGLPKIETSTKMQHLQFTSTYLFLFFLHKTAIRS